MFSEMLYLLVVTLLFVDALAQDSNCDFTQAVQPSTIYYIYSPNYPNSYERNRQCRWRGFCPSGYQCRLDCYLELPLTTGCSGDRLLISRSGDPTLSNAERYCGRQTLTGILSIDQSIAIGFISTVNSPGGRFICNLTAQALPPTQTCTCGLRRLNRIVGGTSTGVNEFTMMVGIIEININMILCGGAIITNRWVMSAAHCLERRSPQSIIMSIGNRDLNRGTMYNATSFRIHPNYNNTTYDSDIALIQLTTAIQFSNTVTPVCLPFKLVNVDLTGATVTITGWGTTTFGGPTSVNLLQADVRVISQQECRRSSTTLTNRQICTLTPGKDACQFDSGGSDFYTDAGTGRLMSVGIVSNGVGCGSNSPAINTRVTEYLNWITNNAPGTYCVLQ